jgi:predicted RNase H-like HicB family nuclease
MKALKYIVYKEGSYFVSQCLNVDVSSFGDTIEQAIENLNEALTLYFEDNKVIPTA